MHDDPLLFPQVYLTKSLRLELFNKHGVKPFPIYQFEGDMVLIPAGLVSPLLSPSRRKLTFSFLPQLPLPSLVMGRPPQYQHLLPLRRSCEGSSC
jgi:hypothetical protein